MYLFKKAVDGKAKKDKHPEAETRTAAEAAVPTSTTASAPATSNIESFPRSQTTSTTQKETALSDEDARFFERVISEDGFADEDGKRPPLPARTKTPEINWESDTESVVPPTTIGSSAAAKGKETGSEKLDHTDKKTNRLSFLGRMTGTIKRKDHNAVVAPTNLKVPDKEREKEELDISRVMDELNLSAKNNKTVFTTEDTAKLMGKFQLILKDLVLGVPTAANDLRALFEDHDGTLAKNYEKLPRSLRKLVTTLPNKLTGTLAPELLAVATEAQGLRKGGGGGSLKEQAMNLLIPRNMGELISKPSAIVGMLKAIVNALKLRWPAFVGVSAIYSIAISLLLLVLWYSWKRGKEVRLERERVAAEGTEGGRVEELPDDPALQAPPAREKQAAQAPPEVWIAPQHRHDKEH